MKNILLFFICFLCSCHGINNSGKSQLHISQLIPKGIWVNEAYLKTLKSTRSLYQAQQTFWKKDGGDIDQAYFEGNTLINGYNLHEGGGGGTVIMKDSFNFESIIDTESTSGRHLNGTFSNDYHKLTIKECYGKDCKTTHLTLCQDTSIEQVYKSILFAKKYVYFDSSGQQKNIITLEENGNIEGLREMKHYYFFDDFNGPGMNLDEVRLGSNQYVYDDKIYGWHILQDTLFIYNLNCVEKVAEDAHEADSCGTYANGSVFLKLVKAK